MPKDVSEWLESLDLSVYEKQFASNDIDLDVLSELNHELLQQMGITSLGHRLRLLKAVADLASTTSTKPGSSQAVGQQASGASSIAERRQLTVMFCDLVDSTGLSGRLDPEDLRDVVRTYQQAAEQVISRFGGHIAQYLGDGLLVYFGYPQAHENDAERAVYAGLGIPVAMAAINERLRRKYQVELSVRIGIHTGPVVVGQMGGDLRQENLALGETPNLAARLEGLAMPNCVTISDSTRRLLGASFVLEALGPQTLKGIAHPMPVFTVLGERDSETRFSADHIGAAGSIVGRDDDLDVLQQCWQSALAGNGPMVLLTGDAGIGKSRVVRGLIDALDDESYIRLTYQCSPYQTDTALYPAFTQLKRAAGIENTDTPGEQLDKLETLLLKGSDDITAAAPLLGSMMGMGEAVPARYGETNFSPGEQRTRALQVLSEQLNSLAKRYPVLFILEDAHWIDPTTQALTELLLKTIAGHRVLLLVTARPGFDDNYGEHSNLTRIELNRLNREQASQIISRVAQGKAFPIELVDEILAKADGVPLFVEEITKTILASGELIETDDAYEVSGNGGQLAVPSSLQDSLMARLDKLQSIKVVAQTAACIGREFGFSLLNTLLPMAHSALSLALNQLVSDELIVAKGEPPKSTYYFKHALVRDAAYESQLKVRRQQVHRDIFKELKAEDAQPQVLAHHAMQAGLVEHAIKYWTKAADFSFSQPAYMEAVSAYERALHALLNDDAIEQTEATQRQALALTRKLIRASSAGRGLTHANTTAAIETARRLQEQVGDEDDYFEVMFNDMNVDVGNAAFDKVHTRATELCVEAERNDDPIQRVIAYRMIAFSAMARGKLAESIPNYEKSLSLYDPSQDEETMRRYGINNGLALRCSMAQTFAVGGLGRRADILFDGLEQTARDLNVPASLGFTLSSMAQTYQVARSPSAESFATRALAVVDNYQLVAWSTSILWIIGAVLYDEKKYDEAIELLSESIGYRRGSAGKIFFSYHLAFQAACLISMGRSAEGESVEQEVLQMHRDGSEQWAAAECNRMLAHAYYQRDGRSAPTIKRLSDAMVTAHEQGSVLWELRAARDLAQIYHDTGETSHAKNILLPIVKAYPSDGHGMTDYVQATQFLVDIESSA